MATLKGIALMDGEIREIPKHGMNLEEVKFAFGSHQLVEELRKIGALKAIEEDRRVRIYSARHVQEVWEAYEEGKFNQQLEILRS